MNSDEDYRPPKESLVARRRSKRITRSETKSGKKINEKSAGKSTTKSKRRPPKKSKPSPNNKQTSPFSSSPLTPEELQQLYEKFSRDGHFSLKPPTSPAPLVVSRSTDGNVVTTKIECYKRKRYLMRELAATMTSPKTDDNEHALLNGSRDPSAVIFSTPLPARCATTVNSNVNNGPYLPADDTSARGNNTKKRSHTQKSASHAHRTSGLANRLSDKSFILDPLSKRSYTMSNSLPNVPEIPSGCSAFSSVASARDKSPTARCNRTSLRPPSSTWDSSEQANSYDEKRNCSTTSGFHFPNDNTSQNRYNGIDANRFCNDSNDDPYGYLGNPSLPTAVDRYNGDGTLLDSQNSIYPANNQSSTGNSSNDWNSAGQISSDNFAAYNSTTMASNSLNGLTANSMNGIPSSIIAYNSAVTSVNNSVYAMSTNRGGLIDNNGNTSEYRSTSFMSWNGVKVLPNNYSSVSDSSYGNMYGVQNSAGNCNASGVFDDSGSQINSWSDDQQLNKDCYIFNDNGCNDASSLSNNPTEQTIENFPVITNLDDDLKLTNGEPPAQGPFTLENFCNFQENGFDPSTPSVCPYDDDITYENYTSGNNNCNDENIVYSTQDGGLFSNLLMNVRNEVRPLFDGEYNYYQFSNDSSTDLAASIFYDFDNKKEIIDD